MTTRVISTDTTGTVYVVYPGDAVYVLHDVQLWSTTDYAIFGYGGNVVSVDGHVLSTAVNAIFMGEQVTVGNHALRIGTDGTVLSNASYASIVMSGSGNQFQNWGEVSGGVGLACLDWTAGAVENHGTLAGLAFAGLRIQDGASTDVLNTGTITGLGGIELTNATATVVNLGDILSNGAARAAVDGALANAGFVLRNAGRVVGIDDAIIGSAYGDRVVNTGAVDGDILLGAGNDLYRGRQGTISGELRGGDGNDTLVGGAGDETIFGDGGRDRIEGGAGDDTLAGGASYDAFVFGRGGGGDTVTDFQDNVDDLDLSAFHLTAFTAVTSRASNVAGGLLIDLSTLGGGTIFLAGMTKALLDAGDVIL